MRVFTASQTAAALPYLALSKAIADVLIEARAGRAHAPERLHLPLPAGGVLLVMPAADQRIAIAKLVTAHPANPASGRPLIQGEVVTMDAQTGERLGVLDGPTLTARRTAAATLLALLRLRPVPPSETLLLFGAGVQARAHLEALREGAGIRRALILARFEERAKKLAEFARGLGVEARVLPCSSLSRGDQEGALDEALREARVLVAATTSASPLLSDAQAALVREDAFVAAVGAFTPDAAELPASLYLRGQIRVDALEALRVSGDLLRALEAGLDPSAVLPLDEALSRANDAAGSSIHGPLIYKSVGAALFDLAAARLAFGVDEFCDLEFDHCLLDVDGIDAEFDGKFDDDGRGCED